MESQTQRNKSIEANAAAPRAASTLQSSCNRRRVAIGLRNSSEIDTGLLPSVSDSQTLAPGAQQGHSATATRDCIGGLVSLAQLTQTYGLTAKQAANFFKGSITIRMGIRGLTAWALDGTINYGTRLTGDHQ